MPKRDDTAAALRLAGNNPRNKTNDFFQFDKIPNGTISVCDVLEITNFRTRVFVHNNIFGLKQDEDSIVLLKEHVLILLGDDEGAELVTELDYSFLVDEFCA